MPELSKSELRQQIRDSAFAPVYVLHGDETYLRDLAAKTILDRAFGPDTPRDFNSDHFSLSDPESIRSAIAAAEQLPMMAERRVVTVSEVRIGATSHRDTLKEEFEPLLGAYLQDPSPQSIVVMVADELNGNRKITKLLKAHAAVVPFQPLSEGELVNWARGKFDEEGCRIDDAVLRYLIACTGSDLRTLENEIRKLATASLPEKVVDLDTVDSLVPPARELSNFAVTDHLTAGRGPQAVASLQKLLADGAEPLMLLGGLSYNFHRLLAAKELMASGADRDAVARVTKLRYAAQEQFLAAARRADRDKLIRCIHRIADTDLAIKTSVGGGTAGPRMQLEMLVCEIAAG